MITSRRLTVAALLLASGLVTGCPAEDCPSATPKIADNGVPTCTGAKAVQAGATVTVKLNVCPRCDQTYDACEVTLPAAGEGIIQLDPLVQICEPDNSCPVVPTSCAVVNCTFQAPAAGNYSLLVSDPDGVILQPPFQVVPSGGATTCAG